MQRTPRPGSQRLLLAALLLSVLLVPALPGMAFTNNQEEWDDVGVVCRCHTRDRGLPIIIEGPAELMAGTTATYRFETRGGPGQFSVPINRTRQEYAPTDFDEIWVGSYGFGAKLRDGDGNDVGNVTPWAQETPLEGPVVEVEVTAPETLGVFRLTVATVSSNGDGNESNDTWNKMDLDILIVPYEEPGVPFTRGTGILGAWLAGLVGLVLFGVVSVDRWRHQQPQGAEAPVLIVDREDHIIASGLAADLPHPEEGDA